MLPLLREVSYRSLPISSANLVTFSASSLPEDFTAKLRGKKKICGRKRWYVSPQVPLTLWTSMSSTNHLHPYSKRDAVFQMPEEIIIRSMLTLRVERLATEFYLSPRVWTTVRRVLCYIITCSLYTIELTSGMDLYGDSEGCLCLRQLRTFSA
jgi:hypothetical protein